jgi:hypothetical protein
VFVLLICGKFKAFFFKSRIYEWVVSKFEVFLGKLWAATPPPKFRGPYIKFIDNRIFGWIVTKFEVLFLKSWTVNIFFRKFRDSYVIMDYKHIFLKF